MRKSRLISTGEQGFTFVELVLVIVMIFVLSGLCFQAFLIYKENAYYGIAQQMMGQTRTAMEAGKIVIEDFAEVLVVNTDEEGPVNSEEGQMLVPGLVLPKDFKLFVMHNPNCFGGDCVQDIIDSRHCSVERSVRYSLVYVMGQAQQIVVDDWPAGGPC